MRLLLATTLTAALGVTGAYAQECGDIQIAEMNWASAGVMANIDKIVLEEGYGCNVELVTGDTVPTFTSMNEKGQPDIAPELWINAFRVALDAAVEEGGLIYGGEVLSEGGVEGWWIPTSLAKEHGITTVAQALEHPELFSGAEDRSKGAFFGCPAGWGCQAINNNLFLAFGLEDKGFELVDPGSAAGLDGSIARAFERGEGWFGYYWAPTAILGKYDMTLLDFGVPHDADEWKNCTSSAECADPKQNAWVKSEVFTVVTDDFAEKAGVAMEYVGVRTWTNRSAGVVLAWMADNQGSNEDGAYYFLENHGDVWESWVSAEVAAKIKAAL